MPSEQLNTSDGASLRVVRSGPFTTVQDIGRAGRGNQGVARSGAFDRTSFRLANRLVGNLESAAVLEILLGPVEFEAVTSIVIAATGTNASVDVIGIDGRVRREPTDAAVAVRAGDRVLIGPPTKGLRTYLSFRGGLEHQSMLGSCSFDSLGKIGPRPIADGDDLHIGQSAPTEPWYESLPVRPIGEPVLLPLRLGPREDWLLTDAPGEVLSRATWTVDAASNRTGIRLDGTPLNRRPGDLASEAMIPGAVQVPPNGLPIVLGPDGGTTGGYPVVGVVTRRGLDVLAQCRPGQHVRFHILRS